MTTSVTVAKKTWAQNLPCRYIVQGRVELDRPSIPHGTWSHVQTGSKTTSKERLDEAAAATELEVFA